MIKKIGVLTSGGDAPGMNAAVAGVIKTAYAKGIEPYIIKDGYKGLVNGWLEKATIEFAESIISYGGTAIGSARLPEFKELTVRENAVNNLKQFRIEALVVVGGDGSYQGALRLNEMGINCVGLPGTIDNDIASTDYTIGFDTALNTAVEAIDRIRDTSQSHNRCAIVEVMGRYCGDIALFAGIATGSEIISVSEHPLKEQEIIDEVDRLAKLNKRTVIVLISELLYDDIHQLAKNIETASGYVTRATVLGHIQRGGRPTAMDRYYGFSFGYEAVSQLINGNGGICIGISGNQFTAIKIDEALAKSRISREKEISKLLELRKALK